MRPETIKAISVWQPWASLIALGIKHFESRSWVTHYRGPLLIHASRAWHPESDDACRRPVVRALLGERDITDPEHQLPRGGFIALGTLTACHEIRDWTFSRELSPIEDELGNYEPGRTAWRLDDVRPLSVVGGIIPARGRQRLFDAPTTIYLGIHQYCEDHAPAFA